MAVTGRIYNLRTGNPCSESSSGNGALKYWRERTSIEVDVKLSGTVHRNGLLMLDEQ
jgi:hypothetical protein